MFKQLEEQPVIMFTGINAVEFRYTNYTDGKYPWQAYYNFPKFEFGLNYMDYGDPIFGKQISAIFGLNYPLLGERFRWSPGFGFGYATKHNSPGNDENKAVSTKISFAVELDFTYEIQTAGRNLIELLLGFRHASNGNIKKPNYGMNLVVAGISYHHDFNPSANAKIQHEDHKDLKKWNYSLAYISSWKDPKIERGHRLYEIQALSFIAAYRFSNINSFTAGMDGFLDSSQYEEYINQTKKTPPFDRNFDERQLAVTIGNTFHYDDLSIVMQAGLYVYRPYKFRPFSYQRYGFHYEIADWLILHAALKAYFGSADAMEFGIGMKL